ncbi:MAG: helix-turn-helix transcriptional regulator [Candidatus Sericytochromatia bacterium]|nr:helix-turn-helix transcriptional regulator [Candidatus Sericytochromatia bacterium]
MGRPGRISPDASPSVGLVREALARAGMTQTELAVATGLTRDHLSRVLLGKVAFPRSRDTLHALAVALGIDPLAFPEYRRSLQVLPESTRRLTAHLRARGISQAEWIRRIVPRYSEGHLQQVLRGGVPFPREAETIALFAEAAEAEPLLFPEYLPLDAWRPRLSRAAALTLPPPEARQLEALLDRLAQRLPATLDGDGFAERLLERFLAKAFGPAPPADPELDDALAYLPPLESYQPQVRALLAALHDQRLTVAELAGRTGLPRDELFAIFNGQLRLKPGPTQDILSAALGVTDAT